MPGPSPSCLKRYTTEEKSSQSLGLGGLGSGPGWHERGGKGLVGFVRQTEGAEVGARACLRD